MTVELLAPAGTVPAFEAALNEGADAVYLGAPAFNARALARDFTLAEIAAMIDFAHARKKRVHLAMNSVVKEGELPRALAVLERLAAMQPDGIIIQDMGLIAAAARAFPGLPLHASTLMTAHNSGTVLHLASLGCRRVVLARELSLEEIGRIAELTKPRGIELELFAHGAMCFSYSGLCRFSSLHGGKSSLRGQCVQPCRRRYQWLASGQAKNENQKPGRGSRGDRERAGRPGSPPRLEGGYLFSMNDLCGIDHLDALCKTGVDSLKIEGRLKSVAYVTHVVRAYRLALDALTVRDGKQRTEMAQAARASLDAAMGRRRGPGFFLPGGAVSATLITPEFSGNTGTPVGILRGLEPERRQGRTVAVRIQAFLKEKVKAGDRLRLHEERSDARISLTPREFFVAGKSVREAKSGELIEITSQDASFFSLRPPFHGRLYRVDVSGRQERVGAELARLIAARNADTPRLCEPGPLPAPRPAEKNLKARWWVRAEGLEALSLRFPFAVSRWLLPLTPDNLERATAGKFRRWLQEARLTWALPPIMPEERLPWYCEAVSRLIRAGYTAFQLGHAGQMRLFPETAGLELFGDHTLNVLNHETALSLAAQGFRGVQFSPETDKPTLKATLAHFVAAGKSPCRLGLLVYGRPALFTARAQSPHFKGHHSLKSPRGERYFLKKAEDGVTVHSHAPFSLLEYGRELAASGLDYLVVDLSRGELGREAQTVTALWSGKGALPPVLSGNYGGVLL